MFGTWSTKTNDVSKFNPFYAIYAFYGDIFVYMKELWYLQGLNFEVNRQVSILSPSYQYLSV